MKESAVSMIILIDMDDTIVKLLQTWVMRRDGSIPAVNDEFPLDKARAIR